MSQLMEIVHLKRSLLWSKELATTLLDFWMKHPEETPAVFRFVGKKAVAFPKFLSKNVMTEKYTKSYDEELFEVATLYERLKETFDPADPMHGAGIFILKFAEFSAGLLGMMILKSSNRH